MSIDYHALIQNLSICYGLIFVRNKKKIELTANLILKNAKTIQKRKITIQGSKNYILQILIVMVLHFLSKIV